MTDCRRLSFSANLLGLNIKEVVHGLRVQAANIGLKINVKKTKSLTLGINEDEKVTMGNEKIDQV